MAEDMVEFKEVRKTFRLRNRSDALRDAIPRMAAWLLGRGGQQQRQFVALDSVSFSARRGEVLGLVGANGAGKSTALRLAAGVYPPNSGSVSVRGRVAAMIELGAGFHPDLSGRENIFLAGALLGLRRMEVNEALPRILEFAEIGDFIDSPLRVYSSGMAVRLGFAVAAHVPAEVLLIDEVLAVGDIEFQEKCLRRMAERRAEGVSVLFVSHNMVIVEQFCDRVVLLHHGKVVAEGPPAEAIAEYRRRLLEDHPESKADESRPWSWRPRNGTGEVRIEDVRVEGENAAGRSGVLYGGKLAITGRWHADRPCADPTFGVSFHTREGALCSEAAYHPAEGGVIEGDGEFRVEFPGLALMPGDYEVSVYAKDSRGIMALDWHYRLYSLKVLGMAPQGQRGLVALNPVWHLGDGGA